VVPGTGAATNMRRLFTPARTATWEYWPSYNPGGTMITYEDDVGVSVAPSGGGPSTPLLTSATAWAYSPAWTPQGNVVFVSDLSNKPSGGMDIYHSNPTGTVLKRLTSNVGDNEITLQPASVR
jgi:Tol biopolymer transport system component